MKMVRYAALSALAAFAAASCPGGSRQQVFEYAIPDATPIVFSAESCAEDARAGDYCLWLDIHYVDGSATWGTGDACQPCRPGTHGWEKTVGVFRPGKPVKKIEFSALFRHGTRGKASFRDLKIERREPVAGEPTKITLSDFPRTRTDAEKNFGPTNIAARSFAVWTADSMRKVTPCTYPSAADLAAPRQIRLAMMKNERESAQICITCGSARELAEARLRMSPLKDRQGRVFDGTVKWERVGYVPRISGYAGHPFGAEPWEKWMPDPLLPAAPMRVRAGATQGAWLTVHARSGARSGVYSGTVEVLVGGEVAERVELKVAVADAALPKTFSTYNSFSVMDGFTRLQYPERFREMKRKSWDVMLDHRLSPDDISRFEPPEIEDLLYARERGMNLFNILNIVPKPKDPDTPIVYTTTSKVLFSDWFYPSFRDRIVPYVAELKKHGLDGMAYVYGFDEQPKEYYPAIDLFWRNLRRDVPGIPLMSTSGAYNDMAKKTANLTATARSGDWFCPLTNHWDPELTDALRKEGKRVWWYTCCGPGYPYMNFVSLEHPLIEARLIAWQTHLYRADGFLFWVVNFWTKPGSCLDESDTFLEWDSSINNRQHGDGVLMYPGKENILPSIRLANVRDGIEDGELLKQVAAGDPAAADAACRRLITDLKNFHRDPALLRKVRRSLLRNSR